MPMTNAEKQAAHRARQAAKLAKLEHGVTLTRSQAWSIMRTLEEARQRQCSQPEELKPDEHQELLELSEVCREFFKLISDDSSSSFRIVPG